MQSGPLFDERLRKLLLYVGSQGKQFQTRDIKHLSTNAESIFQKHLKQQSELSPLIGLITKCIISVPHKQHLYAQMTGYLSKTNEERMLELINCVLLQLQSSINMFKQTIVLNSLMYLSELMNFNIINSFIFLSWLQAIAVQAKKAEGKQKRFYVKSIIKILPYCWNSLDQKINVEFKKFLQKVDKETNSLTQIDKQYWTLFYQQYNGKKLKDYSAASRLKSQLQQNEQFKQFNPSFKFSFKQRSGQPIQIQQIELKIQDSDNLYQQFLTTLDAYLERQNIIRIIESYSSVKSTFYEKIKQYLTNNKENNFLSRFLIQTFWRQIFSRNQNQSIIFSSVFVTMATESDTDLKSDFTNSIQDTAYLVFSLGETLNEIQIEKYVNVISLYLSNIGNVWQWSRWVDQQDLVQRQVILRLTLQKLSIISQFKPSAQLQNFILVKAQPPILDSSESLFQSKIQEKLNTKAQSSQIIQMINNANEFTLFLDSLLAKMSNSLTHLRILTDRYKQVFTHFKFQRQTVTGILTFWEHSQYHKIQYFIMFLQKDLIPFQKFVQGISMKAKLGNSVEKILLKRVYQKVRQRIAQTSLQQALQTDLEQSLAL